MERKILSCLLPLAVENGWNSPQRRWEYKAPEMSLFELLIGVYGWYDMRYIYLFVLQSEISTYKKSLLGLWFNTGLSVADNVRCGQKNNWINKWLFMSGIFVADRNQQKGYPRVISRSAVTCLDTCKQNLLTYLKVHFLLSSSRFIDSLKSFEN